MSTDYSAACIKCNKHIWIGGYGAGGYFTGSADPKQVVGFLMGHDSCGPYDIRITDSEFIDDKYINSHNFEHLL